MRLDEICRADWSDLDIDRRMLMIRDRKDPRNKAGNDQRIPLFAATGFDAWALVMAQAKLLGKAKGPIFPYNSKSVGTAFRRACSDADVKDLHFHDLRHEGTSPSSTCPPGLRSASKVILSRLQWSPASTAARRPSKARPTTAFARA
ncbi:MAG: tyrosine-type recombinase/integrase [Pseudomonadota bacterium]